MFVYARSAIDFWPGWMSESDYLKQLQADQREADSDPAGSLVAYGMTKERAFTLARRVDWEGDIREGPFIAGLPPQGPDTDGKILIAWKQGNNGDTFIASPIRLPWLEEGDYGKWVEE